ncbi:carbon-nitrogen hydrolase family protein [Stutzerimonas tarimensis]|uniref:Carbon-nitrogen hydrolase family protein n=1 Tax=Stutzerimonas tarimensis TaxID=1507735 RepID=A0ABV7T5U7_9GAMM
MSLAKLKVGLAQVAPVFLDAAATTAKACSVIDEAAKAGADMVVFPETYIPAFPLWAAIRAPIYNHDYFVRLAQNSPKIDGPEMAQIAAAARRSNIFVSMGFNEGTAASVGCIWNSNALYGRDGRLLNHRRKIVPTYYEKLVWAPGDAAGLEVVDTEIGRIGALICGENTNPLARYALIAQGEQLHISTYPPAWPTRDPRDATNYNLAEAIRIRAAAHSFEAKVFNVVVSGCLTDEIIEQVAGGDPSVHELLQATPRGVSMVLDPAGNRIGGTDDNEETIAYVDIDLNACIEPKQFHDISGGYNRFDLFRLHVDRTPQPPARFLNDAPPASSTEPVSVDREETPRPLPSFY